MDFGTGTAAQPSPIQADERGCAYFWYCHAKPDGAESFNFVTVKLIFQLGRPHLHSVTYYQNS